MANNELFYRVAREALSDYSISALIDDLDAVIESYLQGLDEVDGWGPLVRQELEHAHAHARVLENNLLQAWQESAEDKTRGDLKGHWKRAVQAHDTNPSPDSVTSMFRGAGDVDASSDVGELLRPSLNRPLSTETRRRIRRGIERFNRTVGNSANLKVIVGFETMNAWKVVVQTDGSTVVYLDDMGYRVYHGPVEIRANS